MNDVLTRVISEQQTKIDQQSALIDSQRKDMESVFTRHEKLFEAFAMLLEARIPRDGEPEQEYAKLRNECRMQMMGAGFCMRCHNFICECEDQYD